MNLMFNEFRTKKYKEAREIKEEIQKNEVEEAQSLQKSHSKQMDKLRVAKLKKQKTEEESVHARLEKNINAKLKQRMEEYEKLLLKIQNYHNEMLNKQSREFGRIQTVHAKLLAKYGLNIADVTERHEEVDDRSYRSRRSNKSKRSNRSNKSNRSGRGNRSSGRGHGGGTWGGNKDIQRMQNGQQAGAFDDGSNGKHPGPQDNSFEMGSGELRGDLVSDGGRSQVEEILLPDVEMIRAHNTGEEGEEAMKEAQVRVNGGTETQGGHEGENNHTSINVDVVMIPSKMNTSNSLQNDSKQFLNVANEVKDPEDTEVYVDEESKEFQSNTDQDQNESQSPVRDIKGGLDFE